jgi:DNA polymerase III subunit delta'
VSIVPLYGHEALQRRLRSAVQREALPSSVLLEGPRGIGKQRLALWLGQLLLCTGDGERPCGQCSSCRYAVRLVHPDLHWFFPRPRVGEADASPEQVLDDYAEAIAERVERNGLYAAPSGSEAIFVATVRAIVQIAAYTPTLGSRKVFVLGDAERMVPQEGADAAANAFLKLLEEPPADTTLILTSSEPGALLPTIRSRVVCLRVTPLRDAEVSAFLASEAVRTALDSIGLPPGDRERLRLAAGSPGSLLTASAQDDARTVARSLLEAARGERAQRMQIALNLGGSKARGVFSDVLDALTALLDDGVRDAVARGDERSAIAAAAAIDPVESAKLRAAGNVSPQLLGASLLQDLSERLP